jgi:mannose-6-phosphate isomerase-like protein (cupin superfamily)
MSDSQSTEALQPTIVRAGEGETLQAFGDVIQFKLGGAQTGGGMTLGQCAVPAGVGPPPHIHHRADELFLVLEGRFEVLVSGRWVEIGPGDAAYVPRGNVHTFRNAGDSRGRLWLILTPSGFETFFRRSSDEFAGGGPPDMGRILEIAKEHGIEFLPPAGGPEAPAGAR